MKGPYAIERGLLWDPWRESWSCNLDGGPLSRKVQLTSFWCSKLYRGFFFLLLFIVKSIDFHSRIFIKDSMIKELKSLNWSILVWIHSINNHLKNFVSLYSRMNIQYLSCQFARQTWWWRLSIASLMQIDSNQTWYASSFSSQNPKGFI